MKRLIFAVIAIACLSSCSTYNYNAQMPNEDKPVNPYDQNPVSDYGIAHAVRGIIISHK
ncbi:MAG: hypothetical protein Q3994_06670 [Prevotella sp.]|nr:hypothetical protein [Prevotella sp.]